MISVPLSPRCRTRLPAQAVSFALLEEKEESADPAGTIDTVTGNVTIDDVAFSYDKEKKTDREL